jgi:diadenosine tetraphosphate (Ap4A) HIT family hydrolase
LAFRLAVSGIQTIGDLSVLASNDSFPFEMPVSARALRATEAEPPRPGESEEGCVECTATDADFIWVDASWRLKLRQPSPLRGLVLLYTRSHYDSFAGLPVQLLAQFGPLVARIERAILSIGEIGRVQVSRSGDGHGHFHVWFYPRPLGQLQLRGALLPMWSLLLEPLPDLEVQTAGKRIAGELNAPGFGGH